MCKIINLAFYLLNKFQCQIINIYDYFIDIVLDLSEQTQEYINNVREFLLPNPVNLTDEQVKTLLSIAKELSKVAWRL